MREVVTACKRERILLYRETSLEGVLADLNGELPVKKNSGQKRPFEAKKSDTVGDIAAAQQDTSGLMNLRR